MANYREPQWLLPNEKNLAMPASDATVGSGLAEDRQSLYSMDFDGTDYISAPNTFLNSASVCSISFWCKLDGATNLISIGDFISSWNGIAIYYDGAYNLIRFRTMNGVNMFTDATLTGDTNWHNIVCVYEGGVSAKIYADGILLSTNTTSIPATLPATTGNDFRIGSDSNTAYSVGKIDEVAIWNKALSAGEITTIYNSGAPGNLMALDEDNRPIAYWPLGEQARLGSEWQFPNEVLQSQVFDFDGSTDFITLNNDISFSGEFSVSMWIKPSSNNRNLLGNSGSTDYLYINPSNVLVLLGTTLTGAVVTLNQWNNIIVNRDSSNIIKAYVNGELKYTSSAITTTWTFNQIGRYYNVSTNDFDGEMSNIARWNSDQTANIANIYNNGSPQSSYTTTPTAWYKLNATSNYAGLNPNFHNALDFVAVDNDYIDLGTDSSLDIFGGDFSVSLWFKHSNASGNALAMLEIAGFSDKMAMTLGFTSNTGVGFAIGTNWATNAGTGFNDGEWHHMVATRTGTTYKIYVDSVDTTITVPAGGWSYNASAPLNRIGTGYTAATKDFNGELSNIAIYNQVISAEDVLYLYNGGTPQTSLSFEPLSWWK
ncbi:MAG: LamG domain-containing protein, partial [Alteromonadales bacterium]|nr:LamG domain-containing protein [Alteromonadales bacterium]